VVCVRTNQQEEAEQYVQNIKQRVDEFNASGVKPWYLHVSVGYAFCRNMNSILLTMEQADKNMYEAKRIWKSRRK
jgi:GGDEF domain-containing protein